jgi:hypothetical protein
MRAMTESTSINDPLSMLAPAEVQRQAAQMAQDAFARVFRLSVEATPQELDAAVGELGLRANNWAKAAGNDQAHALRLALLVLGLDQWGIAYAQAFALTAIPGLSALLGLLRNGLDPAAGARFQQQFIAIDASEHSVIDFKMELRRNIHLALWHALAEVGADEPTKQQDGRANDALLAVANDGTAAESIATTLGSLLLSLDRNMPTLGWRLVADTLAHIQIRCLDASLSPAAQDHTSTLFDALRTALQPEHGAAVFALANQAAASWQQAARASATGANQTQAH